MTIEQMKMPQLGESVTEGTISKWLVSPGDVVQKYDPIAEVMTDKVNAEIPSSFTGVIQELIAKEEETLAVGEVICLIEAEDSSLPVVSNSNNSSHYSKSEFVRKYNNKKSIFTCCFKTFV